MITMEENEKDLFTENPLAGVDGKEFNVPCLVIRQSACLSHAAA
jgi:hypothetical protein